MTRKKIFEWAMTLFIVYLIYEIVRKLLGGSLGYEEIIIGLLIANVGYSFHTHGELREHIGWHKGKGEIALVKV